VTHNSHWWRQEGHLAKAAPVPESPIYKWALMHHILLPIQTAHVRFARFVSVGSKEGHPACKKLHVGLLMVTI